MKDFNPPCEKTNESSDSRETLLHHVHPPRPHLNTRKTRISPRSVSSPRDHLDGQSERVSSEFETDVRREREASHLWDGPDLRAGVEVGEGVWSVDEGGERGGGEDNGGLREREKERAGQSS